MSEDKYDYFNDPEHLPPPEMPQEPDPHAHLHGSERALKCKEEGNAHLKKNVEKAILWYSRGLATGGIGEEEKAVLLSNRAAANLNVANYRNALQDSEEALALTQSDALKLNLLYRASKAALAIGGGNRIAEALKYCKQAQAIKQTKELTALEAQIQAVIKKQLRQQDDKEERQVDKREMVKLFKDAIVRRKWQLGLKFMYSTPYNDSKKIGTGYNDAKDIISMPLIFMYPEYRQTDLVEQCLETDRISKWFFEKLFPKGSPPLPWDTNRVLNVENRDNLYFYVKTNDFEQNTRVKKWVQIDPNQTLGEMILCDPEYVVPKWPVVFVVSSLYRDKFLALDIDKIQ